MTITRCAVWACIGVMLASSLVHAGPPFDPPGPPPWVTTGRSVPLPSSDVLFGLGLAALAWLGPKLRRR